MALSLGIVGMPNVGKSTLFNALTRAQNAEAANYPFCTIEPNKAIVPVPDDRLAALSEIVSPERIQQATVEFVDIAGLVAGASKGEGLGNKFLSNIRETEAILHVVRCFDDENVVHVDGSIDPVRDIEIIELELVLADIQRTTTRLETLAKKAKSDKATRVVLGIAEELLAHLEEGNPACTFPKKDTDDAIILYKELQLITDKSVIYCVNVDEDTLVEDNEYVKKVREFVSSSGREIVKICAKMEEDLVSLDEEEQQEYMDTFDVEICGLEQVIHSGYSTLGLISYFTAGEKEVRAWTIHKGWKAPKSASVIHTDFEKGFIRAEVIAYDDYIENKGESGARTAGVLRIEGKEYTVADGDVMHFRFSV